MSSCIRRRRYGGWGLFSSERYPLPTACSFGSAVVMTAAWSRRSTSEDDTVGCCSCLHVAIEVNFLLRRFDGFEVSSLSCHTVGRQICYNRPNLKSETRTPPGEYYAWWSQEILSVYQLDHKKNICGLASLVLLTHSLQLYFTIHSQSICVRHCYKLYQPIHLFIVITLSLQPAHTSVS